MASMKKATTLKLNYEFRRVYNKGKSGVSPFFVVYARPNRSGRNRLGVTVSTKLGKAVVRNRIRRRLREIYRTHEAEFSRGLEIVFVARGRAAGASYGQLERALLSACRKLKLTRSDGL